ncbi:hypothetical protein B9Z55_026137 [Caenorhabditis nigoni]|uniref:F-box domain-containing protein n=1 Tax=Caenorhabditis nigoni TaxID=1611254 RepID=A0A2G5T290_9PELO|nr:hypothetical protein B9Z55_026137 [Caenorhabditis nigoni]
MNRDFSPPNLDTMPNNALKEILSYLNIKERSVLRKVSRTLREAVDNNYTTVDVEFDFCISHMITLTLDGISIDYYSNDEDKCKMLFDQKSKIVNSDYVETAKKDLGILLKNPNTRINNLKLRWQFLENFFEGLLRILTTFFDERTQNGWGGLCVETLDLVDDNGENIAQVLRLIDVNTIRSLQISCDDSALYDEERFINLPQWRKLRDFQLTGDAGNLDNILNALGNIPFFHINQHENNMEITLESICQFVFTVLNPSENFEYGKITSHNSGLHVSLINAHLILGNVSVKFQQNGIAMEKIE